MIRNRVKTICSQTSFGEHNYIKEIILGQFSMNVNRLFARLCDVIKSNF